MIRAASAAAAATMLHASLRRESRSRCASSAGSTAWASLIGGPTTIGA